MNKSRQLKVSDINEQLNQFMKELMNEGVNSAVL